MLTSTPNIEALNKPFNSSQEIYDWLFGFTNLERGQPLKSFGLDRMKLLADLSKHPEHCAPAFHIAGSKGKGSVTGMITAILENAGLKAAQYTSPHVSDFRERIMLGSTFFDEETYVQAGRELGEVVKNLPPSETASDLSFFELATLWFFLCARIKRCDALVVETGLGGRLDATNILNPLVSIITLIELEHTEFLGNTITEIAGEKAGIIKNDRPIILAKQTDEALAVFRKHAQEKHAPLFYLPDHGELRNVNVTKEETSFDLSLHTETLDETYQNLTIPIPGEVQAYNAALAILAVKTAYPDMAQDHLYKALASFTLPARFQKVSVKPPVVVDGAHTKYSVEMCVATFTKLYGEGAILIFGCAEGKDFLSMAQSCIDQFSSIVITTPGTFKKSNPQEVYQAFTAEADRYADTAGAKQRKPEVEFIPDTEEAIRSALNRARERGLPVLATGSFYLAGEVGMFCSSQERAKWEF